MAFLGSPPRIYNEAMKLKGMAKEISDKDIITKLSGIVGPIYYWDANRQILARHNHKFNMVHHTPWIHQKSSIYKRCGFDHNICFNYFGIIPPRCLECWKVVVNPRNFSEIVKLRALQQDFDVPSKCGIEMRDYTNKLYGGYFYTNSFDEGRDMYKLVREGVNDMISPDVPVILKRGCTEFEMIAGPSPGWHMTLQQERGLLELEGFVEQHYSNAPQSELVQNYVFLKWILWAHYCGDMTYLPWNGGEPLFPPVVTYHEGTREKCKQELAIAKAHVLSGVSGEDCNKMLTSVFAASNEHKIDPNVVFNMAGNTKNVLNFQPLKEVPEEVKGDLDELT
jgi:hypothetical protein